MKRLFIWMFWLVSLGLFAQDAPMVAQPRWTAGFYSSFSTGYGFFTQPFQNAGIPMPHQSFASTGFTGQWDAGVSFRKRWGILFSVGVFSANNLTADFERNLESLKPGYLVTYNSNNSRLNSINAHVALGLSYVLPYKRWYFQSEFMAGSVSIGEDHQPVIQLKEVGTNQAQVITFTHIDWEYKAPTFSFGVKAARYVASYWGFFGAAHLNTAWYNMDFQASTKDLIQQTIHQERIQPKKTAYGAILSAGLFLQINRWGRKDHH